MQMMSPLFQVALGGPLGASARYLAVVQMTRLTGGGFPYGTLTVNLAGSLMMGLALGWLSARHAVAPLLMTGILGGFTTYSAFSADVIGLLQRGDVGQAMLYAFGTMLGAVAACGLGLVLARGLGA